MLIADSYPHFTNANLIKIKANVGAIAKNRAYHYQKTINSYKKFSKHIQLIKVNLYLNQLLPQYDAVLKKQDDYWASPKEFLQSGYGDCEDYAIIKYFTLIKLGFDKEKLYITTVKEKFLGGYHMVLSYFRDEGASPLILDNLSFRILPLNRRDDLSVDYFINAKGTYKIDKRNKLIPLNLKSKEFKNLLVKIKKES